MSRNLFLTYPMVLIVCLPTLVAAETETANATGHVLQYGILDVVKPGKLSRRDDTATGKSVSRPTVSLRQQTQRIPLRPDIHFGYQYRLSLPSAQHSVTLTRVVKHPEMIKPDGSRITGSTRQIRKRVSNGMVFALDGYALNEPYEHVPGPWRFQIWHEETLLVEQTFVTYRPDQDATPP